MMKLGTFRSTALLLAGTMLAATAVAQTATNAAQMGLNIPQNAQFLQGADDGVRKATAIVNGYVITGTDVDHRAALVIAENGGQIPADQMPSLRAQVLRELIDETLQIQAATARDIKISATRYRHLLCALRSEQRFDSPTIRGASAQSRIVRTIHQEAD
jgi:peptidyl-prolyl cis-trans isomerase SurA